MAKLNSILNYAEQYGSVSLYIGEYNPVKSNGLITAGDFAKIFFTGDGHIITHGVDYTPTFGDNLRDNPLAKGLVPASDYVPNQKFKFLGNDGTWKELTVAELPIASTFNDGQGDNGSNLIYTAKQVYDFFQSELSVLDVMKFLGEFNPDDLSNFPKGGKCEKGDTYRASGYASNFAGAEIHAGDLLICIKDYIGEDVTAEDVNSAEYWMVVEANIDGITTHKVNGNPYEVFTSLASRPNFDIYAPTTGGTQDEILVSAGDAAPVWRNKDTLDLISTSDKAKIVSKIEISNEGTFKVTALDNTTNLLTYTPSANNDDWNISIKGKSAGTKNKLTLGTGLHYADGKTSFDGSEDIQLGLSAATKEFIGGVIIDSQNGTVAPEESTISVNGDGMIYLTAGNIANALGFTPGNTQNVYSYKGVITSTNSGTTNVDATNPYFNIIHKKEGDTTWSPASSSQFIGTNGIKIDGQSGNIVFDLQEATTTTYGGIKVFKKNAEEITVEAPTVSKTNRYYGVELDSTGKAFVYVPWADENPAFNRVVINGGTNGTDGTITADGINSQFTLSAGNGINLVLTDPNNITINQDIWKVVSSTEMGYAPAMEVGGELGASHYILSFIEGLPAAWNKLPAAALRDTWRAIKVGGLEVANTDAIDATGAVIGSAIDFTTLAISGSEKNKTKITFVKATSASETHKIDISSTWRPMYLASTEIHKDYGIAFDDSDDIIIEPNPVDAANEIQHISFELCWYNISEDAREIVAD